MITTLLIALLAAGDPATGDSAVIYFNDACHDCVEYVNGELRPLLAELDIRPVHVRDYLSEPGVRPELFQRSRDAGVPPALQGHLTVFIADDIILQGHVPARLIREALDPDIRSRYRRILIYQDAMPGMGQPMTHYRVWSPGRGTARYAIDASLTAYLERDPTGVTSAGDASGPAFGQLMPVVLLTGVADGVNPCAFAVLLLFLGIMFSLRRSRGMILAVGAVFILAVYAAYLSIGLGLLRAITLFDSPHLLAWLGAAAVIGLGLINIKDAFWPGWGPSLHIPTVGHQAIERWLGQGTLLATAVGGFLVGLCTFPCSGGIYVAILGLLASKLTFGAGLGYLLAYNVAFVAPLVAILGFVSNRRAMGALSRWEARNIRAFKGLTGVVMVGLGLAIVIWLG